MPDPSQALNQFMAKYEIKRQYVERLSSLRNYDIHLLCDDSGSMSGIADPGTA
jgi:hypothetical protein